MDVPSVPCAPMNTAEINFLRDISRKLSIPPKEKQKMLNDFKAAFEYLASNGFSFEQASSMMSPERLGSFYIERAGAWYPLDDAAKIYAMSAGRKSMTVFRISVYLKDDVVPELLQIALYFTIKRFPYFAVTLKKGIFWHYLKCTKKRYTIQPDLLPPCSPIDLSQKDSQPFRVLYTGNRISVEFFHAITDGTGATAFLKALTGEYLRLYSGQSFFSDLIPDVSVAPDSREWMNGYSIPMKSTGKSAFEGRPAAQMRGKIISSESEILYFNIDAVKIKRISEQYNVSVTSFLLSLIALSTLSATKNTKRNVQIQVPINMRKFFDSNTMRNFSLFCIIKLSADKKYELGNLIKTVSDSLKYNSGKEAVCAKMAETRMLYRAFRFIPLYVKQIFAKPLFSVFSDMSFSNTLSNIGVVSFPEQMERYIEKMDFVLGRSRISRASCAAVTCGGMLVLSVTKNTSDPIFYNLLSCLLDSFNLLI